MVPVTHVPVGIKTLPPPASAQRSTAFRTAAVLTVRPSGRAPKSAMEKTSAGTAGADTAGPPRTNNRSGTPTRKGSKLRTFPPFSCFRLYRILSLLFLGSLEPARHARSATILEGGPILSTGYGSNCRRSDRPTKASRKRPVSRPALQAANRAQYPMDAIPRSRSRGVERASGTASYGVSVPGAACGVPGAAGVEDSTAGRVFRARRRDVRKARGRAIP